MWAVKFEEVHSSGARVTKMFTSIPPHIVYGMEIKTIVQLHVQLSTSHSQAVLAPPCDEALHVFPTVPKVVSKLKLFPTQ